MSFLREEDAYRRGTVLGLTFAEIMLLLLFLLLIALSFFLQRQEEVTREIRDNLTTTQADLEDTKAQNASLISQLVAAGGNKEAAQKLADTFIELNRANDRIAQQQKEISSLTEAVSAAEKEAQKAEVAMEKAEAWDKLASAFPEGAANPSKIVDQVKAGAANQAVADAVQNASLPTNPEAFAQAINDMREYERLAINALGSKAEAERMRDYWQRRAGLSNELPPCWLNAETSQAEYIFDVALGSDGIEVFSNPPEHRKAEMEALPLDRVSYQKPVDTSTFRSMLRPLYDWSQEKKCRFFVRAFDQTKPHEKDLFKSLLLTTEGYFYKYLITSKNEQPGPK